MARKQIDYAFTTDNDLLIQAGDFKQKESTRQHQLQLVMCGKNDYKQNPTIGVDIESFQDGTNKGSVVRAISIEFMKDGMEVVNLSPNPNAVNDNTVNIFDNSFYK